MNFFGGSLGQRKVPNGPFRATNILAHCFSPAHNQNNHNPSGDNCCSDGTVLRSPNTPQNFTAPFEWVEMMQIKHTELCTLTSALGKWGRAQMGSNRVGVRLVPRKTHDFKGFDRIMTSDAGNRPSF